MTNRWLLPVLFVLAAGGISACGGGSSGGANPPPGPTPTPSPIPTATPKPSCAAYAHGPAGQRLAPRALGGVVPNQFFVTYRTTSESRGVQSIETTISGARSVDLASRGGTTTRAVYLPEGSDATAVMSSLRNDPNVLDVSPAHYRSLTSDPSAGANDTYFDNVNQWYLYKTNVVTTPNTTIPPTGPAPGAWNNVSTGANTIKIAVLDTGVDVTNGNVDFNIVTKVKFLNGVRTTGDAAIQDTDGHGSNTSGLAAALANNGYGFAGVGYNVQLMVYKIFPDTTIAQPCPSASTADEVLAINDAVNNGASVISLSLGSPQSSGSDPSESAALANAIANNVTVVAAAGNEYPGTDGQQPDYPAAYPNVIAVGASAVQDAVPNQYASITAETVASYSNSNPTLVAPGGDAAGDPPPPATTDVLHWIEGYSTHTNPISTQQCSNTGNPPVCRVLFNGTSQATPQVAGTIALMEALHGGPRSLTPVNVRSILAATADSIPGIPAARQGAGRLNAGRAVNASR